MKKKEVSVEVSRALATFPYFVLRNENLTGINIYTSELREIQQHYVDYKQGAEFFTEGSAGNYVPSQTRFKIAKTLIDKEARFMFSQQPDINIEAVGENEADKRQAETYLKIVEKALKQSNFSKCLLQSAKDCFIGKRVACLVDMSVEHGARVHFYTSLEFYYETEYGSETLTKFISFEMVNQSKAQKERLYLVNRYEKREGKIYVSSILYDGTGNEKEIYIPEKQTDLKYIPAVVITNDGTLRDKKGVSEIDSLSDYESSYSRLSNADIDSERKGMNPINYTVDMNPRTTRNLPTGAGAFWDLQHDQNINDPHPAVGKLSPDMTHSEPVKTTLDRIKGAMFEEVDVPNINEETMVGTITSGKALKALYFPLKVRCDEKLKTWKPSIEFIVRCILDLVLLNVEFAKQIYIVEELKQIEYDIEVVENYALMEDELEEKQADMDEINSNTRSRLSYFKKWRPELKTDEQRENELLQIAMELNMFDTTSLNPLVQTEMNKQQTETQVQNNVEEIEMQNNS